MPSSPVSPLVLKFCSRFACACPSTPVSTCISYGLEAAMSTRGVRRALARLFHTLLWASMMPLWCQMLQSRHIRTSKTAMMEWVRMTPGQYGRG